jgi:hypothetical protein
MCRTAASILLQGLNEGFKYLNEHKITLFWEVMPYSLTDTDVSEKSAASIFRGGWKKRVLLNH